MAPAPDASSSLFRQEALDHMLPTHLGGIVLAPKLSMRVVAWLSLSLGALIMAFLIFGSYTRKVTVEGQIVPVSGLIRVTTPQMGVVLERRVQDGQSVRKGDVLFVLDSDRSADGRKDIQGDIAHQLDIRQQSLGQEIGRTEHALMQEVAQLKRRQQLLQTELNAARSQVTQQKQRLNLAQDSYRRYKALAEQDLIAKEEANEREIAWLDQQSSLKSLERDTLTLERELAAVHQELDSAELRRSNTVAQLQREIADTEQMRTEVEGRRRVLITAAQDGTVTLVHAELGQFFDAGRPLAALIPADGKLQARLYAPSESIGFLQAGDTVRLRYKAFPYQKYGQYPGTVEQVSTSAISLAERSELADVVGSEDEEALFAVTVKLDAYEVQAQGQSRKLQTGMRLQADILQERRRLYEWMLEPLFTLTRRAN